MQTKMEGDVPLEGEIDALPEIKQLLTLDKQ